MLQTLLDKLKEKQANLSDYEFAKILNTYQQLWQPIRAGKREIGLTLIKGIAKAYPDLAVDVLSFLGFDVRKVISILIDYTDADETSPEQNLASLWHRLRSFFKGS